MEEQVLGVPTQIFHALGCFQGFCTDIDRYRDALLDAKNVQFRPRSKAETDPGFKQLIPYMIFCHTDSSENISVFQYVRGKGMGESRLHRKRSIGVGGHIAAEDQGQSSGDVYREGMLRELHEEVVLQTKFTERCVGLINDDSTEVGSVHLGIVHRLDVAEPNVISNEPDLIESGFMPLEELRKCKDQMESWSAITLDALFGNIIRCLFVFFFLSFGTLAAELPGAAGGPAAISFDHFPSRLHTFVWRNWQVVPEDRLAKVLDTTVENVRRVAASLGLPPQGKISPLWESSQGYITVLRRNWHLLPYEQLLVLLNQTPEHLAESLREDDFLYIKLGSLKPRCELLRFAEPTETEQHQAQRIAAWIKEELGDDWTIPEEPRFAFLDEFFPKPPTAPALPAERSDSSPFEIRFLFSYFATFGDPLLDPEVASYPEELLRQLAESGVNGIWLHTLLRTLAPDDLFPQYGKDHEIRLQSLRTLVERADRYGIKVYLYMNEPRALPASVLTGSLEKPGGVREGDYQALCTSTPEVKRWLADSLTFVFQQVPNLGGIFTITASENLTHCASHGQKDACPRCKERSAAEIIAEVNNVMSEAVHAVSPDAKTIIWDWGWNDNDAPEIIVKLSKPSWFMSVSEWSLPIERGGVKSNVGEYSISSVGPGPRAKKHWEIARTHGLKTAAKVQFNVTWELAAIPYIPVADLIAEHASNLSESGINGLMLSWSLGGYPSLNLEIAKEFQAASAGVAQESQRNAVLDRVAANRYGSGGSKAREAWTLFSTGYREFPYHVSLLYQGPQQWGAANLFFPHPTGYHSTMVGIPYDDVKGWCAVYPPDVAAGQFRKVADHFAKGLLPLREAVALSPPERRRQTEAEYRFADAVRLHFAASANMIEFNMLRNRLLEEQNAEEKQRLAAALKNVIDAEIQTAREMYRLSKTDARIGYESSNHYFYLPIDIAEAIISARYAKDAISPH